MFCTNCGRRLSEGHRYCGACGTPVGLTADPVPDAPATAAPVRTGDAPPWTDTVDYREVLADPEVAALIAGAADTNPGGMSADAFLTSAKPLLAMTPARLVPVKLLAEVAPDLYARMGISTTKQDSARYDAPPGRVIAAILCSLASRGQTLREGAQAEDGCVLTGVLPSSAWHWAGTIAAEIARDGTSTTVSATVNIPGQAFAWGRGTKAAAELLADVPRFVSLQP